MSNHRHSDEAPSVCPACNTSFAGHWQCDLCHCYGHANVISSDPALCTSCFETLDRRGLAWCRRCKRPRTCDQFRADRHVCKACRSTYRKAYYAEHKEAELAAQKERRVTRSTRARVAIKKARAADPERFRAASRSYAERHSEEIRERRHARYEAYAETEKASAAAWAAANPERKKAINRAASQRARQRRKLAVLSEIKQAAQQVLDTSS